jgi:glutamate dehydrogenase/leucine dehydrogenase
MRSCTDKCSKTGGIVYAPDFLINAGGIITVYAEVAGYNMQKTMEETAKIYDTTLNIIKHRKRPKHHHCAGSVECSDGAN